MGSQRWLPFFLAQEDERGMGKGLKSESGSLAAPRLATLIGAAVAS